MDDQPSPPVTQTSLVMAPAPIILTAEALQTLLTRVIRAVLSGVQPALVDPVLVQTNPFPPSTP